MISRRECAAVLVACWVGICVRGYPDGAPVEVCLEFGNEMYLTPQHGSQLALEGTGGFTICQPELFNTTDFEINNYIPGDVYELELLGNLSCFRGFVIQAVDFFDSIPIGQFIVDSDSQYKHLNGCTTPETFSTITHIDNSSKASVHFSWKAPNFTTVVDMMYTVVTAFSEPYYGPMSALENQIEGCQLAQTSLSCTEMPAPSSVSPTPLPSVPPGIMCPSSNRWPLQGGFRVTLGEINGRNYSFAAQTNVNDDRFVDIQLEAQAMGWVAIGFSTTSMMAEADVLVCVSDAVTQSVAVIDMWNPLPNHSPPVLDSTQDGLCVHDARIVDGIISCSFSRLINVINDGQDLNLYNNLFQMYGYGDTPGSGLGSPLRMEDPQLVINMHEDTPDVSYVAISIGDSSSVFVILSTELTRLHGILMMFSWGLMAVSAIFMSMWMRPVMTSGEWLEFHWGFMIASILFSGCGFAAIFVANYNNHTVSPGLISFSCGKSTAHFVIGLLVITLQFLNVLLSACRCNLKSPHRWIYNLLHGNVIGLTTLILALLNVGLGITVFEDNCDDVPVSGYRILWVYIGFVAFLLVLNGVLFFIFTISAWKAGSREEYLRLAPSLAKYCVKFKRLDRPLDGKEGIEMTDVVDGEHKKKVTTKVKQVQLPSMDSKLRWTGMAIFFLISTILVVAMIGMLVAVEE